MTHGFKQKIYIVLSCTLSVLLSYIYFTSEDKPLEMITGTATYYGEFFHGKVTTSGEVYNMNDMTAAHPSFPFGTIVRIVNLENGNNVIVKINDRPRTDRKSRIDLSKGAFKEISDIDSGVVPIRMEVLRWGSK